MADQLHNDGKIMFTNDGGLAVPYINNTGGASVKGRLLKVDITTGQVVHTDANDVTCIGAMYSDGVANGAEVYVVVAGKAKVLLDDNTAGTAGNWVECSEAGYADATAGSPAAAPEHFREIGHCIETVGAGGGGTHVLCLVNIHFL